MNDRITALAWPNLYAFLSAVFSTSPSRDLTASLSNGPLKVALEEGGWALDLGTATASQDIV
jgi:hypothetical protein